MNLWNQYKAMFITFLIAIVIGFGGGFYTKSKFVKADEAKALSKALEKTNEVRKEDARNVANAQTESEAITVGQERTDSTIESIKKEIRNHAPVATHAQTPRSSNRTVRQYLPVPNRALDQGNVEEANITDTASSTGNSSVDSFLTVGELRLLNRAYRLPITTNRPSGKSDGETTGTTHIARASTDSTGFRGIDSDQRAVHRSSPINRRHVPEDGAGLQLTD